MTRQAGLLAMGLLLALGTLAVAYGLWSKTLSVGGTVHTGNLDAWWTMRSCGELHGWVGWPPPDDYQMPQGEYLGKDVGSVDASVDPGDRQIMHFTVQNGYPSYVADCQLHYKNVGDIPLNIIATTIVPTGNLTNCVLTGNQEKVLKCDQLTVVFVDGIGTQLDPGDSEASSLLIHVEQPAKERTNYEFDVLICAAQWNENPTPQECFDAAHASEP